MMLMTMMNRKTFPLEQKHGDGDDDDDANKTSGDDDNDNHGGDDDETTKQSFALERGSGDTDWFR